MNGGGGGGGGGGRGHSSKRFIGYGAYCRSPVRLQSRVGILGNRRGNALKFYRLWDFGNELGVRKFQNQNKAIKS